MSLGSASGREEDQTQSLSESISRRPMLDFCWASPNPHGFQGRRLPVYLWAVPEDKGSQGPWFAWSVVLFKKEPISLGGFFYFYLSLLLFLFFFWVVTEYSQKLFSSIFREPILLGAFPKSLAAEDSSGRGEGLRLNGRLAAATVERSRQLQARLADSEIRKK
jgi:hypothetical protein